MAETSIEWTATPKPDGTLTKGYTFNGWIGCTEDEDAPGVMSEECRMCYAREGQNHRVSKAKGLPLWGPQAFRQVTRREYWKKPLQWQREAKEAGERRKVFAFSLGDIFEDFDGSIIGDPGLLYTMAEIRERAFQLTYETPDLDWLMLTKRPQNVPKMVPPKWLTSEYVESIADIPGRGRMVRRWPRNVWIGTTAGTQRGAERRIPHLMKIPAFVRFISQEPQLELIRYGVDLDATMNRFGMLTCPKCGGWGVTRQSGAGPDVHGNEAERRCGWCSGSGSGVDWIIMGGESGKGARPYNLAWPRQTIRECKQIGIHLFMKQAGALPCVDYYSDEREREEDRHGYSMRVIYPDGSAHHDNEGQPREGALGVLALHDKKGGDLSELPEDLRVREWPTL